MKTYEVSNFGSNSSYLIDAIDFHEIGGIVTFYNNKNERVSLIAVSEGLVIREVQKADINVSNARVED